MTDKMPKRKESGNVRPIRTKRDLAGASTVARDMSGQQPVESAAEKRLQSLLHEMEKFDDSDEDESGTSGEEDYSGPQRRWSDDTSDPE